jgi:hypothetical protein
MRTIRVALLLASSGFILPVEAASSQQPCSTQKANGDCTVTIDRRYPITPPIIQLKRGAKVSVVVLHPLDFEMLSLDPQSAQAVFGTDQLAGILNPALAAAKSLVLSTSVAGLKASRSPEDDPPTQHLAELGEELSSPIQRVKTVFDSGTAVYRQLQEIVSPLPRPELNGHPVRDSLVVSARTPDPWNAYREWREWLLCELEGRCSGVHDTALPSITNFLAAAAQLAADIAAFDANPPKPTSFFDTAAFNKKAKTVEDEIHALPPGSEQQVLLEKLKRIEDRESRLLLTLPEYDASLTAILKDLGADLVNIEQWPAPATEPTQVPLGELRDPRTFDGACLEKIAGCQVSFAVNEVNAIVTPPPSLLSPSAKKSIVTLTILYADPRFEVSSGAFFSSMGNRSFDNEMAVTVNPGAAPVLGNVTIKRKFNWPAVVPFAAGNWRIGSETLFGDRRVAFYASAGLGISVASGLTEFAAGPSVSYRAAMLSAFVHLGHDVHLTQGEFEGEIWCNQTVGDTVTPRCGNGLPQAPSTERFWRIVYAVGISVRAPSVFASGGAGGK